MDFNSLEGRTAIVTGAAHGERAGLGVDIAKAMATAGANVVLVDLKDCADVAAEIESDGGAALPLIADVSDEGSVRDMTAKAVDHFGQVDILVNNAAFGSNIPPMPVTELPVEAWDELMAVNVRGPFLCVKALTPHMRSRKYGKIVNIGSTTMMSGLINRLHYVSAKGAILAMTRSLAAELGPDGIRVNTLAYGLITSRLNEGELGAGTERGAQVLGGRALRDHVRGENVVGGAVFLASSASDHMTGQIMIIDGGETFY